MKKQTKRKHTKTHISLSFLSFLVRAFPSAVLPVS